MTNKMMLNEVKLYQNPVILENIKVDNIDKPKRFRLNLIECDIEGSNKRIYPLLEMDTQITKIKEKIEKRQLVGELDHPHGDERSQLVYFKEQSHLITNIKVNKDNKIVEGEFEIIQNNPNGKILMNLLEQNISIGSSLRQSGELKQGRGNYIVESLDIITWDIVSNPSYPITYFTKQNLVENINYLFEKNKDLQRQSSYNKKYKNKLTDLILFKLFENDIKKNGKLLKEKDIIGLKKIIFEEISKFTSSL